MFLAFMSLTPAVFVAAHYAEDGGVGWGWGVRFEGSWFFVVTSVLCLMLVAAMHLGEVGGGVRDGDWRKGAACRGM